MTLRLVLRSVLVFALAIGIGLLIKATPLGSILDEAWIDSHVRGQGLTGELIFIGLGAIVTSVGLPRQAVAFFGGYAFGVAYGTVIAVIAAVCGCIITFCVARLFARNYVRDRYSERFKRFDAFLHENTFTTTLLIRFLPIGSNLLTNLFAGVSGVSALAFFAGSALGYIPQMLIFALVGSGFAVEPGLRLVVSVALFAVAGVMGLWLYRRYRDSHHLLNAGVVDSDDVGASEARDQ